MTGNIQKLHNVWLASQNKSTQNTVLSTITFDDLTNSIISTGKFYYYIIDFYDMTLSYTSTTIDEIHGFHHAEVLFNDILESIHPDDVAFVVNAEAFLTNFFFNNIAREKLLKYKISYCFRARLANGTFGLFNHQALMLTLDDQGKYGKSLNIHTHIDHLSFANTYRISLIGLDGEPSYMNLNPTDGVKSGIEFSKREIEIIKHIADGMSNIEIGEKLHISPLTVKKHRDTILKKSKCKNTAHLIKTVIQQGFL
jgi:DNA-binding CsgD family transcriptional regulator